MPEVSGTTAHEVYERVFRTTGSWRGWRVLIKMQPYPATEWAMAELKTSPTTLIPLVIAGLLHRRCEGRKNYYSLSDLGFAVLKFACPCCNR